MFEIIKKLCLQYIVCPPESADKFSTYVDHSSLTTPSDSLINVNQSSDCGGLGVEERKEELFKNHILEIL